MSTAQLAAGLLLIIGLSMAAGWVVAFRNRPYLGLLGGAFLSLSFSLLAGNRVEVATEFGGEAPGAALLAKVLLLLAGLLFLLALVAAAQETRRRFRELHESHRAAEEALLAMMQTSREREAGRESDQSAEEAAPGDTEEE